MVEEFAEGKHASSAASAGAVSTPVAILDVDGTLVDTNYHHAIAWYRAFRQHGLVLPLWRIHRHIGMGGDQLVAALAGDGIEERAGDDIRAAETALYLALIDEVQPFRDARELLVDLQRPRHARRAGQLGQGGRGRPLPRPARRPRPRRRRGRPRPTSSATKPAPDLVQSRRSTRSARGPKTRVLVGDTPWDVQGGRAGRGADRSRCSPAASPSRSCATPGQPTCTSP